MILTQLLRSRETFLAMPLWSHIMSYRKAENQSYEVLSSFKSNRCHSELGVTEKPLWLSLLESHLETHRLWELSGVHQERDCSHVILHRHMVFLSRYTLALSPDISHHPDNIHEELDCLPVALSPPCGHNASWNNAASYSSCLRGEL